MVTETGAGVSDAMWALRVHSVANSLRCWYALVMYQPLNLVSHENVPLFYIRHDLSISSLILALSKLLCCQRAVLDFETRDVKVLVLS